MLRPWVKLIIHTNDALTRTGKVSAACDKSRFARKSEDLLKIKIENCTSAYWPTSGTALGHLPFRKAHKLLFMSKHIIKHIENFSTNLEIIEKHQISILLMNL